MAYSFTTGEVSRLVAKPLELASGQATWNPTVTKGLYGEVNRPCEGIVGLTPNGIETLPITIKDGGVTWRLDDLFHGQETHCASVGQASYPAWSPDGKSIAFFASTAAIGSDGVDRLDAPWDLFLMNPVEQVPRVALSGIVHAHQLAWSPDSRQLVFGGEIRGEEATWLFAPGTKSLTILSHTVLNDVAWAPDGRRLVALHVTNPDEWPTQAEILILSLSSPQ
jgi:hypothetical protein